VHFNTLDEFRNSSSNFNKESGEVEYYEGYQISSDGDTDAEMEDAAKTSVESDYNVLSSSCIDVSSDALEAGGFDPGKGIFNLMSPIPNERYENIKKNNSGKTLTKELKPDKEKAAAEKKKADDKKQKEKEKKQKEKENNANEFMKSHLQKIPDTIYGSGSSK
jgi:hypothetical protein